MKSLRDFKPTDSKAKIFIDRFIPYRKKYTIQGNDLFGEPYWITLRRYLSDGIITKAILGRMVVGYFLTSVPNTLGIDIDDHRGGKAWSGQAASPLLLNLYDQVRDRLRGSPSLLIQSPRGLHAFWILTERLPAELLNQLAGKRLKGLQVEVKPTPSTALRIPAEKRIIDPRTFQLLNQSFEKTISELHTYHPAILFDEDFLSETVRESLQEKKNRLRVFKHIPRIEKAEKELLPLEDGNTNTAFLKLCLVYRCAGLDIDQALYRFALCLERSPVYTGDLHDPRRLRQRIESEFRKNRREFIPQLRTDQESLFNGIIAERIAERQPFAKQRREPIKRFIEGVLSWADWHDEVVKDRNQLALFDFLYPYYRKYRREGFYPLPRSYLRTLNQRYFEFMDWLEGIGFIEPAPYKPSARLHICKYYRIITEK